MTNVIVAFYHPEDAQSIKNILVRRGFQVVAVCHSGAQALACAEDLHCGIIVCGYQLTDMLFLELHEWLPPEFSFVMVSSPGKWTSGIPEDIVCLPLPLKVHDLISALERITEDQAGNQKKRRQPKQRSAEEQLFISKAKALLMERNNMTEEEAHRYIQKRSMDSGTNILKTAQMVIYLNS